jgi:hypothetical protein
VSTEDAGAEPNTGLRGREAGSVVSQALITSRRVSTNP